MAARLAAQQPGADSGQRRAAQGAGLRQLARAALLDLGVCLFLALLPLLYFWRLFAPNPADQVTVVEGDFSQEYFPVLVTAARALREGALPLWNPYSNGGQPLLADPQSALLYPPTWWALRGIHGFDGDSFLALERLIPLHFALAGVLTYALGRALIGARVGALVAALTFTYSGFMTSYPVQQLPILRTVVWFPLQVLGLWLALERRRPGWAALGGGALGLAILAGHPQTAFLEGVGLSLVAAVWAYQQVASGAPWRRVCWAPAALALLGMVGLGLSVAQWLPTYEFMRLSSRATVGYDFLSAGFRLWEVPLDLLAPRVLGGLPPYVGVLPLVLAAVALALRRPRYHGAAAALAVFGATLALGGHSFLYPALYRLVPGFDLFRQQERAIFLGSLGVALLAGSGAAALAGRLSRPDRRRLGQVARWGRLALAGALALGGALYLGQLGAEVSNQGTQRWRDMVHWYFFFIGLLGASLGLLALRPRLRSARALLPALLVALVAFDLFTVSWETNLDPRRPEEVFRASEIVLRLQAEAGLARAVDQGVLNGNHGLVYGIPTITESFVLHLKRFEEASRRVPQERLFDLLDVDYVVTREPRPEFGQVLVREQFRDLTNLLYQRRGGPGAAWVVPEAVAVARPEEALQALADERFDPRARVVLEAEGGAALPRGGPGSVHGLERGWDEVRLEARAAQGGYLVLSEVAYPGWRAEVDGVEQPILLANYLLRAVWLAPGDHRVTLRYEPPSLQVGLATSLATLAALGCWLVWAGARTLVAGRRGRAR
ncbi:MAG: YfhO family protein [Chloroflexi bacterium]|nr:YfhO family protein [Chloroflexota bacterium]